MKRVCVLVLTGLMLLSLCGCFLAPAEDLYAVPKQSADINNLQTAIQKAMPTGAVYCPPTSGENQQAVQLVDLDGDMEDEAVVYLKTDGDMPLSICVFDKRDGIYTLAARMDGVGSAFDTAEYVQIDGIEGNEIVVGREIGGEVTQILSVYALRGDSLAEVLSVSYAEFITADLDSDGLRDILVLRDDGNTQNGVAEYYRWKDNQMVREREQSLSTNVAALKRIITGKMSLGVPAVFVAAEYGEGSIITDIFALRGGKFTNICHSDEVDTGVETVRDYYVYSCDIDGDGLIELPYLSAMPELPDEESSRDQSLIYWYNLLLDGSRDTKLITYHNYSGGWFLTVPEEYVGKLAVKRQGLLGNTMGYCFVRLNGTASEELFTLAALTGENALRTAQDNGWEILAQKGETVYACRMEAGAASCGIAFGDIKDSFRFIHVEWKTGETD